MVSFGALYFMNRHSRMVRADSAQKLNSKTINNFPVSTQLSQSSILTENTSGTPVYNEVCHLLKELVKYSLT